MKTILIPSDFSIKSLKALKNVIERQSFNQPLKVVLLHGLHHSDSITELLTTSRGQQLRQLKSEAFMEACEVLKNKFQSQIKFLYTDIFSGYTQSAFDDYLTKNKVEEIYYSQNLSSKISHNKRSFDLKPFVEKSKIAITAIDVETSNEVLEQGEVAELFMRQIVA